jgi:hypothetical protein
MSADAPQVNWDRRVQALAECEALVVGSAAEFGAFTDLFRALLRDVISAQIADRSADCREQDRRPVAFCRRCLTQFEDPGRWVGVVSSHGAQS